MMLVFLLNTVIEGFTAFLFLFYPEVRDWLPGFGGSEGPGVDMLTKMYGIAALIMALLTLIAYFSRAHKVLVLTTAGLLFLFHLSISAVQFFYNTVDQRGGWLHLIMALLFAVVYAQQRRLAAAAVTS